MRRTWPLFVWCLAALVLLVAGSRCSPVESGRHGQTVQAGPFGVAADGSRTEPQSATPPVSSMAGDAGHGECPPLDPVVERGAAGTGYVARFTGTPVEARPACGLTGWDVQVHSRDKGTWRNLESMDAQHGEDCAPPPAIHESHSYGDAVFQCRDHVMTSIKAGGYGVIYLTPDQLLDFSNGGTARLTFDVSTLRTAGRDWIDLWVTPYSENVALPLDDWMDVDLQGLPRDGIHIRMDAFSGGSGFRVNVVRDFVSTEVNTDRWSNYEQILSPSAAARTTFELDISATRVKFGIPAQASTNQQSLWWADVAIPALNWSSGVVQLGHHSYNPEKDCAVANEPGPDGTCRANTWHWDNVTMSPAVPFTMIKGDRRYLNSATQVLTFNQPAPAGANLRFSAVGKVEVSFDGGAWVPGGKAETSMGVSRYHAEHMSSYWMPVPAGASTMRVRFSGDSWYTGPYIAKDFSIWATN